jgi:predicted RNase H-like HicB family nuclease
VFDALGRTGYTDSMANTYTAVTKKSGEWWIGWVEEVPGVNCQEQTKDELLDSLRDALKEALDFNRRDAIQAATSNYSEELLTI